MLPMELIGPDNALIEKLDILIEDYSLYDLLNGLADLCKIRAPDHEEEKKIRRLSNKLEQLADDLYGD